MAVTVKRGVLSRIREDPGSIVIQVRGASDSAAATAALDRAAREIEHLDAGPASAPGLGPRDRNPPAYVSPVLPTGAGPVLMIDGEGVPYAVLRTIPEVVARHLTEAGIDDAVVASPRQGGPLTNTLNATPAPGADVPGVVVAGLYPPPPLRWRQRSRLPEGWIEEACAWVGAGLGEAEELQARVVVSEFPLAAGDCASLLGHVQRARTTLNVVAGELHARARLVAADFISPEPCLALAFGGPAASDEELVAVAAELQELARRLASQLAYAYVTVTPTFGSASFGHVQPEWLVLGGDRAENVAPVCDEYVLDGFAWQILGPGHLARLGGAPPGARPLDGGRMDLAVGELGDWLITASSPNKWILVEDLGARRRNPDVQERARALVAPCLLRQSEASRVERERWAAHEARRKIEGQAAPEGPGGETTKR